MVIGELADAASKRVLEYKRRRKPYLEKTFRPDENELAQSQGWELVRENKTSHRFRKLRDGDEQLENEFWRLLYELGYHTLNVGRNFQIVVADKQDGTVTKQIDVFGYDEETIIVAECRTCKKRTKQSLETAIGELAALQGDYPLGKTSPKLWERVCAGLLAGRDVA